MPVEYLNCRRDPLQLDPDRLASLFIELGEHHARQLVDRAMDDLADAVQAARVEFREGQLGPLGDLAFQVEQLAEPLGLAGLARVCADVAELCEGDDFVALAAALGRMERLCGQAQRMVWKLGDLSGA